MLRFSSYAGRRQSRIFVLYLTPPLFAYRKANDGGAIEV